MNARGFPIKGVTFQNWRLFHMTEASYRRLFFGLEIEAPWPTAWPAGRLVQQRHLTLAFLGSQSLARLLQILSDVPRPPFQIGPCGWFDYPLFLPKRAPRTAGWHIHWFSTQLFEFQSQLARWLSTQQLLSEASRFLPHVTLCRNPVKQEDWEAFFRPLPCFAGPLHLYESLGNSHYRSLWSFHLLPPFEEIEHTADIAFHIRGQDLSNLYQNACTALAFKDPSLLTHWREEAPFHSLEDVVIAMNRMIGRWDQTTGCPFKAVSFHGQIESLRCGLLQWEMIVDI